MPGRDWDDEPEYDIDPDEYDDYDDYEYEDEDRSSRRRSLMVLSVLVLLIVFAGVVFVAYQQGMKQGIQGQPPVLEAENTPNKVAPKDPGGVKIPHQENTIYDRIDGSSKDNEDLKVEQLLPPAEEPVDIPKSAQKSAAPAQGTQSALDAQTKQAQPKQAETKPVETAPTSEPAKPEAAPAEDKAVEEAKAALARSEPPSPTAQAKTSGGYVVQLAAFRDEDAARAAFRKLQGKHSSLLGGLSADIQRADLGDKGIYYRLRAGYLDKNAAAELCAKLKAQGQGCLVRPK